MKNEDILAYQKGLCSMEVDTGAGKGKY